MSNKVVAIKAFLTKDQAKLAARFVRWAYKLPKGSVVYHSTPGQFRLTATGGYRLPDDLTPDVLVYWAKRIMEHRPSIRVNQEPAWYQATRSKFARRGH